MVRQQPGNHVQQQWIYDKFEGLNADLKMDRNVVCEDTHVHTLLQLHYQCFTLSLL